MPAVSRPGRRRVGYNRPSNFAAREPRAGRSRAVFRAFSKQGRRFRDRAEAGRVLGEALRERYGGRDDVVVLALPRGGVPVGYELARILGAQLDVFVVRKLGVPDQPELAMGAIARGGARVFNRDVVQYSGVTQQQIEEVYARESEELRRREELYRGDRPWPELKDKIVVLVDDGLATGATMRAAVAALRQFQPAKIVVAVPVAAPEIAELIASQVDDFVCPVQPSPFHAVGIWYDDFSPTSDQEVRELLGRA
ncbi:MAG TPA: phosphoribosyltransferase [Thermomicrobiales bacterium]|nr:phosphoribosyltransferase [Thermomicrobiales bacterium]